MVPAPSPLPHSVASRGQLRSPAPIIAGLVLSNRSARERCLPSNEIGYHPKKSDSPPAAPTDVQVQAETLCSRAGREPTAAPSFLPANSCSGSSPLDASILLHLEQDEFPTTQLRIAA